MTEPIETALQNLAEAITLGLRPICQAEGCDQPAVYTVAVRERLAVLGETWTRSVVTGVRWYCTKHAAAVST